MSPQGLTQVKAPRPAGPYRTGWSSGIRRS